MRTTPIRSMACRALVRCSGPKTAVAAGTSIACPRVCATSTPSPADKTRPRSAPHLSLLPACGIEVRGDGETMAENDTRNQMKQKLAAGELVLCMNLRLARTVDIAMVAKAGGYDALYVDMQHAPYSVETTGTICAAALGIGITPLVRVPSHDGHWMSRVLDGGAQG